MRRLALAILAAAAAAVAMAGCGSSDIPKAQQARLDVVRKATAIYATPVDALARGYFPAKKCVKSTDGEGSLGTPFLDVFALKAKRPSLLRPQELFYDFGKGKTNQLLGVGYYVADTGQRPPDTPFGHMEGPLPATGPGQTSHYELHVWLYKKNPDGIFDFWNKDVKC